MTKILGIDPGESHTGLCVIRDGEAVFWSETERWQGIREFLGTATIDVVVAEDFRLYPSKAKMQSGDQMWTARVLGAIQFMCEMYKIPFELQSASRIRSDPLVKDVKVAKSKHINDAAKHALAYWYSNHTDAYKPKHD